MKFLKVTFFTVILLIFFSFLSSCSDRKNTYYEITSDTIIYHYVERRASNLFSATYHEMIVKEVDLNSFSIIDKDYAKDKNRIYHKGLNLGKRDVKSFKVLPHSLSKDKFGAYYRNQLIVGSDGESFKVLNASYYQDNANVYSLQDGNVFAIKQVDYKSFKIIKDKYAKDKNSVFYQGNLLEGIDSKQFKLLTSDYCIDPNFVYYQAEQVAANAKYFQVLANGYAKDDNNIFYQAVNINADYNSFKIIDLQNNAKENYFAEDKYFYYTGITAVKK